MITRFSKRNTGQILRQIQQEEIRNIGIGLASTISYPDVDILPRTSCLARTPSSFSHQPYMLSIVRFQSSAPYSEKVESDTNRSKSVEEEYTRKSPLEHVMLRPGMYVGPTERLPPQACWILDTSDGGSQNIKCIEMGIVPALLKVFDEILVNASDNFRRHPKNCNRIDVQIHPEDPFVSITNNGKGIPVQIHKEEGIWIPELLFGHLLTGSNFDDDERRVTGGRHGYGAKLANIFSRRFEVEIVDSSQKKRYRQVWENNMSEAGVAVIEDLECEEKMEDYTKVSFIPDLPRLTGEDGTIHIAAQDYALLCRRVVDVAGCAAGELRVTLNGRDISCDSFQDYCQLYRAPTSQPMLSCRINPRWEVVVGLSTTGGSTGESLFESISFVNSVATTRGGTHVNHIVQQITKVLADRILKQHPDLPVTQSLVRRHLFVACNALIENPSFDSQMKEALTSGPTAWGSDCVLPKSFLANLWTPLEEGGPGIVEEIVRAAHGKQQASLFKELGTGKRSKKQLLSIHKLEDAHQAGAKDESGNCTLILTEGDSAKALAVAGLEVIGRECFGVFPLRGKFLNVRHATTDQLTKNAEVKALCAILGLDFDKEYGTIEERRGLRYGHVMLMTDSDTDGSHIKGLVINFFRYFWPKLLRPAVDGPQHEHFLSSFLTPLLKARKGKKEVVSFYSMAEYNEWRANFDDPSHLKSWSIKYYKGLGTSTPAEAKEYFTEFDRHVVPFRWNSEVDGELLDMVFDKERASDRRDWILHTFDEDSTIKFDPSENSEVSYEDFLNKDMIHFSNADNIRSLPSVIDGLKPSQRKVLYACFKRKLKSEIKVAQLTGYCAEHTAYHHGEASLHSTIIGMAQDFVGSNNLNLLVPSGQFGTRLEGGKDSASPRYIFTHLSPVARYLFPEADDVLLQRKVDDGQIIEPLYYCPIIPLLLVNGAQGIGTGWSTFIPPHDPKAVLDYVRAKLDCSDRLPKLKPWARDFLGEICCKNTGMDYVSVGKIARKGSNKIEISELPLWKWTNTYKQVLLKLRDNGDIVSFVENHTTTKVSFTVAVRAAQLIRMEEQGLDKVFKLRTKLQMSNMHAFDHKGGIQKFDSAEEIAETHFAIRLEVYNDRKSVLESDMNYQASMVRNKARFIQCVSDGQIDLRRATVDTISALKTLEFDDMESLNAIRHDNNLQRRPGGIGTGSEESVNENDESTDRSGFDYLLNMPLSSLTAENIQDLNSKAHKKEQELCELRRTTPEDLWRSDLDRLEPFL